MQIIRGFYLETGATKSVYIFRHVTSSCLCLLFPCVQQTKLFRSVVFWPLLTMWPANWGHFLKSLTRKHRVHYLSFTFNNNNNNKWQPSTWQQNIRKEKNKTTCLTKHLRGSRMAAIDVSQTDPTINRNRHNTGFPLIDSIDVELFCFTQSSPKGGSVLQMFGSK